MRPEPQSVPLRRERHPRNVSGALLAGVLAVSALLAVSTRAVSDDTQAAPGFYLRVGALHVGDGTVRRDVTLRVVDGRIEEITDRLPDDGADVRAYPSAHVTPGWVDAVTHLGVRGGAAERVEVLTPGVRAADAFDRSSEALDGLARTGVTAFGVLPAPVNVASGRAGWCRVTPSGARVVERAGAPLFVLQRPALDAGRVPATLAGARELLSRALRGAVWSTPAESRVPVGDDAVRDLAALDGGAAYAWVDTPEAARMARDVLGARRLSVSLIGLTDALDDAPGVASLGLPCVVTALGPDDALRRLRFPAQLSAHGAPVALASGAPAASVASLRRALALAVANGLPTERAVPSVTSVPARALGASDELGTLAVGRSADLVVFDGEPWEPASAILLVVSEGRVLHERQAAAPR